MKKKKLVGVLSSYVILNLIGVNVFTLCSSVYAEENTTVSESLQMSENETIQESSSSTDFSESLQVENNTIGENVSKEEVAVQASFADEKIIEETNFKETPYSTLAGAWGDTNWVWDDNSKTFTLEAGTLIDPGKAAILDSIGKDSIKHIIFTGPVKLVGNANSMFGKMSNLETVNAEQLDVSEVTSMSNMFAHTKSLSSLNVSNWDTSNVTSMAQMFMNSGITSLDSSNWNTSNVTNMRMMFHSSAITTLNVSNWDTGNVMDMESLFSQTEYLTTLYVSNWDTSKVTNMRAMFSDATSLTSLDVSNWDVSSVNDMGYMFGNTTSLTSLDINNWDVRNVKHMGFMFSGADSLNSLDVSNWDTTNSRYTTGIFNMANLLELVLGPKSLFQSNLFLPEEVDGYTDRWIGVNSGNIYDTSKDFLSNYDGAIPDTYRREKDSTSTESSTTDSSTIELTSNDTNTTESNSSSKNSMVSSNISTGNSSGMSSLKNNNQLPKTGFQESRAFLSISGFMLLLGTLIYFNFTKSKYVPKHAKK